MSTDESVKKIRQRIEHLEKAAEEQYRRIKGKMTLEELESLKQARLSNQPARLQAARANADRAEVCIKGFRAAGFDGARLRFWESDPSTLRESDVEGAGELLVEGKRTPLAEAERLVAELDGRDGKTEEPHG